MAHLLTTPQLSLPFRVAQGGVVCHEQDTDQDRVQNAVVVLRYETGQRSAIPDFGIPDPTFLQGGVDVGVLQRAVKRWEPDVTTPDIESALNDEGVNNVHVEFEING